jgi:hypothetical protein
MKLSEPLLMGSLIALAAGTWWLATSARRITSTPITQTARPGYYLNEATFLQTDDSGRVMLTAHTVHAEQLTSRDTIRLTTPDIVFSPKQNSQWLLTSTLGLLLPDSRRLSVEGDVRLRALEAKSATGAVVHTEHMQLDLDSGIASTDDPVAIQFSKQRLSGSGLRADLNHETFRLESKVNGTFTR